MAYLTTAELLAYLDIDAADEDSLLLEAITDAQSYIEAETSRFFEAQTLTKVYDRSALSREHSRVLDLDEDLLTITTLTNGDSASTVILPADYWLLDRNLGPPYHQIKLKTDIATYWEWEIDEWVSVLGTWGYTDEAPGDIKRACTVLAAYFYRQKDSQIFDTIAMPEAGIITIPQGIPATVVKIIKKYRRWL